MSAISTAIDLSRLDIAVARKQLDAIEQQGQDALALIDAATPAAGAGSGPPPNAPAGVGTQLNVVA